MKYKLRAEYFNEVSSFIKIPHNGLKSFSIKKEEEFPDIIFEFESDLTLEKIIAILRKIRDSHVMYQTVKSFEEYTGERNFDL